MSAGNSYLARPQVIFEPFAAKETGQCCLSIKEENESRGVD